MKDTLRSLFQKTLDEAALEHVMADRVSRVGNYLLVDDVTVDVARPVRIVVVAIGKAAHPMCVALVRLLPVSKTSGVVVSSVPGEELSASFRQFIGGHPYPNEQSVEAADHLLERLSMLDSNDLVIYLLSGGGSAICEAPFDQSISLQDVQKFYAVLVTCGANIVEMNVLRKHLSRLKGGRLAQAASPVKQVTLYVSDVPPDRPSTVASGPTMPDESTCEQAYEIAGRLGIVPQLPNSLQRLFAERTIRETPKPGDEIFRDSQWCCLSDNQVVLERLEKRINELGWIVERDLSVDDMPVEMAVDELLNRLETLLKMYSGNTVAVTTGGELSSPVMGTGMGGRNQAFVLNAARKIVQRGLKATVLSAGTDGIDGNSPAAGAVADESSIPRAESMGIDVAEFEERSDSYHFFERLEDLIVTGPTGNNVRDLRVLVAGST